MCVLVMVKWKMWLKIMVYCIRCVYLCIFCLVFVSFLFVVILVFSVCLIFIDLWNVVMLYCIFFSE